tara:strand:- start:269 stop:748 length:480 start_codon:yes stop_codon:yes gene_type:complete
MSSQPRKVASCRKGYCVLTCSKYAFDNIAPTAGLGIGHGSIICGIPVESPDIRVSAAPFAFNFLNEAFTTLEKANAELDPRYRGSVPGELSARSPILADNSSDSSTHSVDPEKDEDRVACGKELEFKLSEAAKWSFATSGLTFWSRDSSIATRSSRDWR